MSELETIRSVLFQTARRLRFQRVATGFWRGLLLGSVLWLLVLAVYKLLPLPDRALLVAAGVGLLCPLAGAIVAGWGSPSLGRTARWVDGQQHLQERLSTALEVSQAEDGSRWRELVISDAARHAEGFDVRRALPWQLPQLTRWTVVVLALAAGLGFVPEYRSPSHRQKQTDAASIRESGRQITNLTHRVLSTRPPALEPTRQTLEAVQELGQQLTKLQLNRTEALRELASASDRVKEQLRELGRNQALRKLEAAARHSPSGAGSMEELQKRADALQQQLGKAGSDPAGADKLDKLQRGLQKIQEAVAGLPNLDSSAAQSAKEALAKALGELGKQAEELGVELPELDEAIKALASGEIDQLAKDLDLASMDLEKLAQMAKALKELKAELAELGKTLGEQLEKGQALAAISTLDRMQSQLKSGKLSPEELQRLLEEVQKAVGPAAEYGKVGELLAQAAGQLKSSNRSEAGQRLNEAAEELRRLLQQMGDCEGLMAALDNLKQAQLCIGNGKAWGMCAGTRPGFKPGGRPGRGVGTWGDDSQQMDPEDTGLWDNSGVERPDLDPRGLTEREARLNDALTGTRVKGQMNPGGPMPSITLKGVSIKGQSRVQYEEAVTSAQGEAQSALSHDQVPRNYRGAVKDYFDDLKE